MESEEMNCGEACEPEAEFHPGLVTIKEAAAKVGVSESQVIAILKIICDAGIPICELVNDL